MKIDFLALFKNKFFIITIIFIVWVSFFAQYDLLSLRKQRKELNEMKEKIIYLQNEVAKLQLEKYALKNDTLTLEKYAREKYFMKANNEDVFVIDSQATPQTEK